MLCFLLLPALAFDHNYVAYAQVLSTFVSKGKVDYASLKEKPEILDGVLGALGSAEPSSFSDSQRKAFYLNAYNALTLDLVADSYPIGSIRDLDGGKVWDTRTFQVGRASMTLNQIENSRLRTLGDPRIHAAINCAALSCPPLASTPFVAVVLDVQLDAVAQAWARSATLSSSSLSISRIFDWFSADFLPGYGASRFDIPGISGKEEAALNFIAAYDPARAPLLQSGKTSVVFEEYNWALNQK